MDVNKLKLMERLQKEDAMYVLISGYTKMPYVVCDEETFDDEVLLFFNEESAKNEAKRLMDLGNQIGIAIVDRKKRLEFFTSLFPIGVNCLRIEKGTEEETTIQHNELVKRGDNSQIPDGKVRVENPELHLTALYFVQEYRRKQYQEIPEELEELYEEVRVNFGRGQYIVPSEEGKGIPLLKQNEGKAFLPVFTDFQEFMKFNREGKLKGGVLKADQLTNVMTEEATGVVINPFGVNLIFSVAKK